MIIEKTEAQIKHEPPPFGKPLLADVLLSDYFLTYIKLSKYAKLK
jgi:hypothetical protein